MKCPNCPKPSVLDFGTLAVQGTVATHLGQFHNIIYYVIRVSVAAIAWNTVLPCIAILSKRDRITFVG